MSFIISMYMIKYRLICDMDHEFDGWFPNSREFTKQQKGGLLLCPVCDSPNVAKGIMAPNISKKHKEKIRAESLSSNEMMPASQAPNVLRRISKYITKNFENVGNRFYNEAIKCKDGERNDQFYGTPTQEQTNKLLDEGMDLFHVPKVKDN
jgi:hypothetical protein